MHLSLFPPIFSEPIVNVTRQPTPAPTTPRTPAPTPRAPKAIAAAPAPSKNCNPRVTNVEFEGKHYFVQWKNRFATKYTWDGAKNSCARIGMKMISMDNPAKREFFLNMLERDHYEYFWAGGKINRCISQLMAMITWAKKKFKQIYQYRAKVPMVLRLKYPPIWADLAEHANCYLLKKCCFLIFL